MTLGILHFHVQNRSFIYATRGELAIDYETQEEMFYTLCCLGFLHFVLPPSSRRNIFSVLKSFLFCIKNQLLRRANFIWWCTFLRWCPCSKLRYLTGWGSMKCEKPRQHYIKYLVFCFERIFSLLLKSFLFCIKNQLLRRAYFIWWCTFLRLCLCSKLRYFCPLQITRDTSLCASTKISKCQCMQPQITVKFCSGEPSKQLFWVCHNGKHKKQLTF